MGKKTLKVSLPDIFSQGRGSLLVWLLPTMTQLMSVELIASAEALVTGLTGKWFLTQGKQKKRVNKSHSITTFSCR